MSVKKKIDDLSTTKAEEVTQKIVDLRLAEFKASGTSTAEVVKINDDATMTVKDKLGNEKKVVNITGRFVGVGQTVFMGGDNFSL